MNIFITRKVYDSAYITTKITLAKKVFCFVKFDEIYGTFKTLICPDIFVVLNKIALFSEVKKYKL